MKKVFVMLMLLAGVSSASAQKFTPAKHVVIIGVDGLSPKGIEAAHPPNIDRLIQAGAHSFTAQANRSLKRWRTEWRFQQNKPFIQLPGVKSLAIK